MTIGEYPGWGETREPSEAPQPRNFLEEPEGSGVSFGEEVSAVFQRNNPPAEILAGVRQFQTYEGVDDTVDPDFNWPEEILDTKYEPFEDSFYKVDNRGQFEAVKAELDRELEQQRIEDTSGWGAWLLGQGLAVFADPTIAFPGGAAVRGVRGGYSVAKTFASVAAASGGATAVSEGVLQATQETRSALESTTAIGGSIIIGGILGAGAAKMLSRAEIKKFGDQYIAEQSNPLPTLSEANDEIVTAEPKPVAGGSDVPDELTYDDLEIYGKTARVVAKLSSNKLAPGIQTQRSPSVVTRRAHNDLVENTLLNEAQAAGRNTGTAVETTLKFWQRGALTKFLKREKELYKIAKNEGFKDGRQAFVDEISYAARRADEHENPHIQAGAEALRDSVFDPLLRRSDLPNDMPRETALSYVTRIWNRLKVLEGEVRLKSKLKKHFSEELENQFERTEEFEVGERLLKLEEAQARVRSKGEELSNVEKRALDRQAGRKKRLDKIKERKAEQPVESKPDAERRQDAVTSKEAVRSEGEGWRVVNRDTGETVYSTQQRSVAKKIDSEKYEVLPEREYLELLNKAVKAGKPRPDAADVVAAAKKIADSAPAKPKSPVKAGQADEGISKLLKELEEYDRNTDKIKDKLTVTKSEAAALQKEVDDINASLADVTDAQRRQPRVKNILKMARFKRDLAEARIKRSAAKNRKETLERIDNLSDDLDMELSAKAHEVDNLSERIVKIEGEMGKLEKFMPTKGMSRDEFVSEFDVDSYIEDAVRSTYNNILGKNQEGVDLVPAWMVPVTRGPLKEIALKIDDDVVEEFLENDARFIAANYVRTMGAEVEMQAKFGRADMRDQLDDIALDYERLRAEARAEPNRTKAQIDKKIRWLDKYETRDVENIRAFRDQARGMYRTTDMHTSFGKATRLMLAWNYMRLLGGVTLSSASDAMRVATSHGIGNLLSDVITPMFSESGRNARKIAKAEAREMGAVVETYLNSRLATLAELQDPYANGSVFERVISNGTTMFSKATGLPLWNDVMKSSVATMTQNRIFRNLEKGLDNISAGEKRFMAKVGIGGAEADMLMSNFKKFGRKEGPTYISGVDQWDDAAKLALASPINKMVDQVVVTKGIGDTPLFMHTNGGRLLMQFKSFALASHQRVLIAGLQDEHSKLLSFLVGGTVLGMMVSYLKMIERGDYERAEGLVNNPGRWTADGFERTGIASVPFDMINTADKVLSSGGAPAFGTSAIGGLIGRDDDRSGGSTRYVSRNALGAVFGPSAGPIQDVSTVVGQLLSGDLKKSGANAIIRQVPGATLPFTRAPIHHWAKPMLQDAVK